MAAAVKERQQFTEVRVHQIAGKPPDGSKDWSTFAAGIPLYEGIDPNMLYQGDSDPFHVTLDIFKANVTSENGMFYDEQFIEELLKQLPGLGSKDGHAPWMDTGSFADEADWIGHVRVGDTWYAKAYIPPGKIRDNVRRIMARKGKLRTSVETWGTPVPILDGDGKDTGTWRLADPELEAVDMVRGTAAALKKYQSGQPIYSSETKQIQTKDIPMPEITIKDVPQAVREQIIRESQDAQKLVEVTTELDSTKKALETAQAQVATLQTESAERDTLLKTANEALKEANQKIADSAKAQFETMLSGIAGSFTEKWKVNSEDGKTKVAALQKQVLRAVREAVGDEKDPTKVKEIAEKVWSDEFKGIAEAMVAAMSGGAGIVAPKSPDGKQTRLTDEQRASLKKEFAAT